MMPVDIAAALSLLYSPDDSISLGGVFASLINSGCFYPFVRPRILAVPRRCCWLYS